MGQYSAGFSVAGVNVANTQVVHLVNTAATERIYVKLLAVGVSVAPTTAPSFYVSRSTARGTQATTLAGQPFDLADTASTATLDLTWTVAPTFSTTLPIVRGGLAVTAGGWWVWDFRDQPLVIPATTGSGLVIVNGVASGATLGTFAGYACWEE
jgi:hypothetical protein